jgi:hypothetical protein
MIKLSTQHYTAMAQRRMQKKAGDKELIDELKGDLEAAGLGRLAIYGSPSEDAKALLTKMQDDLKNISRARRENGLIAMKEETHPEYKKAMNELVSDIKNRIRSYRVGLVKEEVVRDLESAGLSPKKMLPTGGPIRTEDIPKRITQVEKDIKELIRVRKEDKTIARKEKESIYYNSEMESVLVKLGVYHRDLEEALRGGGGNP